MIGGMAGHPLFAALYDRMTARAERAGLADLRASALEGAAGRTLELGAGTGANAARYPAAVTELVLTEPDPHVSRRLHEKLAASPPAFDDVSGLKPVELPASPPIVRPAIRGSAAPPSG